MTVATLSKQLGLEPPKQSLPTYLENEILDQVAIDSDDLVKSIQDDTVTAEQIDSFLLEHLEHLPSDKRRDVHAYLLSKKATLLFHQGREAEGLTQYEEALGVKETPSTWALKGSALLQMGRLDEAFLAFRKSYSLKEDFGPQRHAYLEDLLGGWSVAALLRALYGLLEQNAREAEKGAFEYIDLLNIAKRDNLEQMVLNLAVQLPVAPRIKAALEELEVMVRLLSIEDPFEGWRALSKESSKVWPKGLSAVKAVREMRR